MYTTVPFSIFDKSDDNKASVASFATIEASKENMVGHRCSKRRKKINDLVFF